MKHCSGKHIGWGILFGIIAVVLLPLVLMSLWNWLMPAVFGLSTISFIQALGLFILSKLLFSGFSGHRHSGCKSHRHSDHFHKFKEKMETAPVEEMS